MSELHALGEFWDRHTFSIGGVDFTWLDVALSAMARGQWPAFERRLAEGLACASRADREDAPPSQDTLDAAATAFRYDHDLISVADVTAWLERTRIDNDHWIAYLNRDLLRTRWADELEEILERFPPSARELLAAAVAEGICSGVFATFEEALAGRAAFVFENDAEQFQYICRGHTPASLHAAVARLAQTHAHWVSMRPADDSTARLAKVLQIESAFNLLIDRVAANGRLNAIVESNRLEWMRIELDTVSFAFEAAAREAMLCIREDGLSLHDVAALSRRRVARSSVVLEDVDPEYRDRLLAAEPGRVLGPLAVDGHFDVTTLLCRTTPSLGDPVVAARARQALVDISIQHAARNHVARPPGN
jgi:hypothetical protein